MIALLLAAALCPAPHRSQSVIALFEHIHACPDFINGHSCATYEKVLDPKTGKLKTKLYRPCGACQVDHRCALACGGADELWNLQWLLAKDNRAKSDDCSACRDEFSSCGVRR